MFEQFLIAVNTNLLPIVYKLLIVILPVAMPFMLIYLFWVLRLRWIQMRFIEQQPKCLLEIKLPKEISKSPAAMEIFFTYFSQGGAANYTEAFLDGRTRSWFTCELASMEGEIHFYVWTSNAKKFKDILEAQLYAQYPNIEIYDVTENDYTKQIPFDPVKYGMYGLQYTLSKADVYPIKTYVDYGLDKDQKDEYKIDPMTAVIEFLGSMRKGEYAWIQILVRKHEKEGIMHGRLRKKPNWEGDITKEIENIRKSTMSESDEGETKFKFSNPTKGQNEIIAALERSKGKVAFDCMIRSIYIAEYDLFRTVNIGGMIGSLRQYNSNTLNGFRPNLFADTSDEYKDVVRIFPFLKKREDRRVTSIKKELLHAYKLRSFFEWPYKFLGGEKPFILTTEELATIFHFPSGIVSQTPTLNRVPSKKSEAPANLPI